jgi:branched-chain amino acid transport system ATP-binding protein
MTALLAVQDLVAGYGPAPVLHGATLEVAPGEIVALLGSNGAGKSTFNNNVCGLYRAWRGRIRFGDDDITASDPAQIVARGLIQVPEGRRVFPNLSVRENLLLGAYRRGHANRARNFERILETFPRLRERLAQAAGTLSGGEQQMLAIGRGLMAEPRLLILDEPSLGLSPLLVEEMFALIERLNREGLAVLLVEQNVVQSLAIAHRAYVMENGRIVLSGEARTLAGDPELRKAYLGM